MEIHTHLEKLYNTYIYNIYAYRNINNETLENVKRHNDRGAPPWNLAMLVYHVALPDPASLHANH